MPGTAVEVSHLTKAYRGVSAVEDLSLTARAGQVTAVLGPNGAGKTTTIECCEGLRRPDSGRIRVLGLDPWAQSAAVRARTGVMLQDGGLPLAARASEVLAHVAAMYARPRGDLVERLGLGAFARTSVRRLSGGERQRLALACAVVGRPELVFLDEPTAGLDPQARHAVWDLVRELRASGVAVVLSTHHMEEAESLADQVVIVDRGRVIAEGAPSTLVADGTPGEVRFAGPPGLAATMTADLAGLDVHELGTGTYVARPVPAGPGASSPAAGPPDGAGRPPAPRPLEAPGPFDTSDPPHAPRPPHAPGPPHGPRARDVAAATTIAALGAWAAAHGVLLTRFTAGARTLEDVFLDLTGRELR